MGPKSPGVPLELNNEALKIQPFGIYLRTYPSGKYLVCGLDMINVKVKGSLIKMVYMKMIIMNFVFMSTISVVYFKKRLNRIEIRARFFLT